MKDKTNQPSRSSVVTGFNFEDVYISFINGRVNVRKDGHWISTTDKNMQDICIQYLALYNPSVLKEDN